MPFSERGIRKIICEAGEKAELDFPVHPHMLRHACGYYLALHGQDTRAIQAYLGHRSIEHTVRYTALAPDRFKDFWQD
jgi:type 1 fimbriae regulatory protein FimB/type 1 fimbriae regulatory protein FimE